MGLTVPLGYRENINISDVGYQIHAKELGNPEFVDAADQDPSNQQEVNEAQLMIEKSIQQILDNAIMSESGFVDRMCRHLRPNVLDETDGLNKI